MVGNALAFTAPQLCTLNTAHLLMEVTKAVAIHGFDFPKALDHCIQECSALGKHTGIIHFSPHSATKYLYASKKTQPWGKKLMLQCPQCGVLNPWKVAFIQNQGYALECRSRNCGVKDGKRHVERFGFHITRPDNATFLVGSRKAGWLKIKIA
jgi:hypothetical protein